MKNLKVLVVDDDDAVVGLLKALLKALGYEVLTANDGPTGIELAQTSELDAILMDVNLPGMDGLMATFHIKSAADTRNVALIMMSGALEGSVTEEARRMGCNDFLDKPFSLRRLKEVLERAISARPKATVRAS